MISKTTRLRAACLAALSGLVLVVCGVPAARAETAPATAGPHQATARIVPTKRPLQCVPFARKAAGIQIRGDAWTWWDKAKGRYERGPAPRLGAVLVMKKTSRLRRGHLAVVTRIVNQRMIVVDQANWLNRGRIHLDTAVLDVSANNDWSAVRVWYTPEQKLGARTYPVHGFIYADPPAIRVAATEPADSPAHKNGGVRSPAGNGPAQPPARKPARAGAADSAPQNLMTADSRRG